MGGHGNVPEMRSTLLSMLSRRIGGIEAARSIDPWFFPDEQWIKSTLEEVGGFEVVKLEREWRPTRADEGGVEGWVRFMGKIFFDALAGMKGKTNEEIEKEKEDAVREVCDALETVCGDGRGGYWIGYVRLRGVIKKV